MFNSGGAKTLFCESIPVSVSKIVCGNALCRVTDTVLRCSVCKIVQYCSEACHQAAWRRENGAGHVDECSPNRWQPLMLGVIDEDNRKPLTFPQMIAVINAAKTGSHVLMSQSTRATTLVVEAFQFGSVQLLALMTWFENKHGPLSLLGLCRTLAASRLLPWSVGVSDWERFVAHCVVAPIPFVTRTDGNYSLIVNGFSDAALAAIADVVPVAVVKTSIEEFMDEFPLDARVMERTMFCVNQIPYTPDRRYLQQRMLKVCRRNKPVFSELDGLRRIWLCLCLGVR